MTTKNEVRPAVIEGVRLERWINTAWDDNPKFRLIGVLVPVSLMKDPLSTGILSEVERRVNSHEALLSLATDYLNLLQELPLHPSPSEMQARLEAMNKCRAAIAQASK